LPKKTLETIVKSENNYLVQVKDNQPNLSKALKKISKTSKPVSTFAKNELNRGRLEFRGAELFKATSDIPDGWTDINSIIKLRRVTQRNGKISDETSFYISNLETEDAETFAKIIRGHWSIENRLHWVKDVIQNEDNAKIKKGNGIETLSIFRNIAINISRELGYDSIKNAQIYFASNVKELCQILLKI
jgi:predicted transposase YbfD/YdcC